MIKAIIFDFGGVFTAEGSLRKFAKAYAKKAGCNPEKFKELVLDNWFKARVNKISSESFWKNLSVFLKTDAKNVRSDFIKFFGFRQDVLQFAIKLKKNYKLGLLSNHIEDWLEEIIKKRKMRKVFDVILTSYESRLAKPDIAIFKEIVKKLKISPNDCVYIDDMEKNILPAKMLGMNPILFKNLNQLKKELVSAGIRISDFEKTNKARLSKAKK
ncbi:MAG: HAD family phosphatase [Candidatus ainarchaeum sp.]|nr:HAD family phosphatase [Candidatus ainarchaeum sp.]